MAEQNNTFKLCPITLDKNTQLYGVDENTSLQMLYDGMTDGCPEVTLVDLSELQKPYPNLNAPLPDHAGWLEAKSWNDCLKMLTEKSHQVMKILDQNETEETNK